MSGKSQCSLPALIIVGSACCITCGGRARGLLIELLWWPSQTLHGEQVKQRAVLNMYPRVVGDVLFI